MTATVSGRHFRRDVGLLGLTFVSVGSIIGSGWLFGALYAAQAAGPAALVSWGLGAMFMLLLALIHAELGGAFPVAAGTIRFPHYSHGALLGFTAGWIWWLGAVTIAPIEVEAALQYFTHYVAWLTTTHGGSTVLTAQGYGVAIVLMFCFAVINVLGVRRLAGTNTAIVFWKIAIPVLAIVALLVTRFHGANFHAAGGFAPYGFRGIFSAMSTGGVIFALQGFEQAIQIGGESANPRRNIPLAVVGAMLLGVVVYVLLQVAFLGALEPGALSHGWSHIAFKGLAGPFAGLASAVGLGWLAVLLYIDAAVSPGGTGLLYTATSSRVAYALSHDRFVPRLVSRLSSRGVPDIAIVLSFLVGCVVFLPFPGWQKLVGFITSASALVYGTAPLALSSLRRQLPDQDRPFRLPLAGVLAPAGFIVANLIVYWSGWPVVWRVLVAIGIGYTVFALYRMLGDSRDRPKIEWRSASWLVPYLAGLAVLSRLGQYDGSGTIPFWWDVAAVAVFSVAIYAFAVAVRLPAESVRSYIDRLTDEDAETTGAVGT
ncbi:MAG TPA: APC family permease [Gaiellaceae bacterium]|nr:APC family permease [Gaiellaceae bacterium]